MERDAKPKAMLAGKRVQLEFNLRPWALTKGWAISGFNGQVSRMVPLLMSKFSEVEAIELTGIGQFTSIRGHDSEGPFMRVMFTRANAGGINWKNIDTNNVPKLADSFWAHPSYYRDD
jgi:hypothetical protein